MTNKIEITCPYDITHQEWVELMELINIEIYSYKDAMFSNVEVILIYNKSSGVTNVNQ